MKGILDTVRYKCNKCGKQTYKTMKFFRTNTTLVCGKCGMASYPVGFGRRRWWKKRKWWHYAVWIIILVLGWGLFLIFLG